MPELGERRSHRKREVLWLGVIFIIAGMTVVLVWGGLKFWRVRTCLGSSLARLRTLQDAVPAQGAGTADLDLMGMGAQLHGLQADLSCLRDEVQAFMPLAPLLAWLPEVGEDVASAPLLLDLAQALVDGGVLVFDGLSPLIEEMQPGDPLAANQDAGGPDLAGAVVAVAAARPSLAAAEAKLQQAAELQTGLNREALSPRVGRLLDLTERYLPLLQMGVRAAQVVPELLGVAGTRTYLVLAQNDDERRPTGGWISGMGLLTVEQGQITEFSFQDSWAVDNLEVPHDVPPDDMFRVLWAGIWLFRDANWSPDFPTSAQIAEQILERDQGIVVEGVIAVDQQALRLLVAALEPLILESSGEAVTGTNVLTFMRESWTEPQEGLTLSEDWAEWTAHRKDFMYELVRAMLERVQTQPQSVDLTKLASAVWRGLQERHIMVYLHDAEAAKLLESQGWDGALLETPGDYLQVVDSNVGFNKVDPHVLRAITYHIDLTEPELARAEAIVHYQNTSQRAVEACVQGIEWLPSYQERMHGCYWDYVRVYVPEGASLLTAEREPLPPGSLLSRYGFAALGHAGPVPTQAEQGKGAFGLFFVLAPGEERDVRVAWQLPAGTFERSKDGWHYQLLVQKQSGAPAVPLRVTVTLPPGSRLSEATPDPFSNEADRLTFDLLLGTDQRLELEFEDVGGNKP